MKECNKCKQVKSFKEFNKDKTKKGGHSGSCSICAKETARIWRENNRERDRANARNYNRIHRKERYEYQKIWLKENKDHIKEYDKKRRQTDKYKKTKKAYNDKVKDTEKHKEYFKKRTKEFRKQNPKYVTYTQSLKRAKIKNATPKWITKEIKRKIRQIYSNCPEGYHVDHIIPLVGKYKNEHIVCGLHIPANLQYLKDEDNLKKNCKVNLEELIY